MAQNYIIVHDQVGPFSAGQVVSSGELTSKRWNADINHLLKAGAIAATDSPISGGVFEPVAPVIPPPPVVNEFSGGEGTEPETLSSDPLPENGTPAIPGTREVVPPTSKPVATKTVPPRKASATVKDETDPQIEIDEPMGPVRPQK